MKRHHKILPGMPGSGGELARHLIDALKLDGVTLEQGGTDVNHYDPSSKTVRLCPKNFNNKSLTAVAVAAHEVGHAVQYHRREPLMVLRTRLAPTISSINRTGQIVLVAAPLLAIVARVPHVMLIPVIAGLAIMFSRVVFHLLTLPVEWDASFGKALPILKKGGYVPDEYLPAIRQVLKAAAMTYVAGALMDLLNFWRWFRFMR